MHTPTDLIYLVIGSGGLYALLQMLIQRHWSKKDGIADINKRLDDLSYSVNSNKADLSRRRILNFNSEILKGERHTREDFEDVLQDIDEYDDFCKENPKYPNTRAEFAEQNIKDTYRKCMAEHDFL